jgi:hypothetical protein
VVLVQRTESLKLRQERLQAFLGVGKGVVGSRQVLTTKASAPFVLQVRMSKKQLHRQHASKGEVRLIDFSDDSHLALLRMWEKRMWEQRQRGYRAMGYRMGPDASDGQTSMEDVEVPGLVPSEQLFAGKVAAANVANGLGP